MKPPAQTEPVADTDGKGRGRPMERYRDLLKYAVIRRQAEDKKLRIGKFKWIFSLNRGNIYINKFRKGDMYGISGGYKND